MIENQFPSLLHQYDDAGNLLWVGGSAEKPWIVTTYSPLSMDASLVGGKSAKQAYLYRVINGMAASSSLDENVRIYIEERIQKLKDLNVHVENQYAVTIHAYAFYLKNMLPELQTILSRDNFSAKDPQTFENAERSAQELLSKNPFPSDLEQAIVLASQWLQSTTSKVLRAVRSTAPSEDGGKFSGSGKYSTFLEVTGTEDIIQAIHSCFSSRFNQGALAYQHDAPEAFGQDLASLSFAVMVQSMEDFINAAGTMFTADTQSGHTGFIEINVSLGAGEAVVSGRVTPDRWMFAKKQLLADKDALVEKVLGEKQEYFRDGKWHQTSLDERGKMCLHGQTAPKIAKAGALLGELFAVIDPESVQSDFEFALNARRGDGTIIITQQRAITTLTKQLVRSEYVLTGLHDSVEDDALRSNLLLKNDGINAGVPKIVHGVTVKIFGEGKDFKNQFGSLFSQKKREVYEKYGEGTAIILITAMTFPWMEPYMAQCVACVTTRGGKNDHTPIWCKEHGLPAAVSVKQAPDALPDNEWITYYGVDEMPDFYAGRIAFTLIETKLEGLKPSPIPIRLIISDASTARIVSMQNYHPELNIGMGSGLVRWEQIASEINVHPVAVLRVEQLEEDFLRLVSKGIMTREEALRQARYTKDYIRSVTYPAYASPAEWYIDTFARKIAAIVSCYDTKEFSLPMTIRLADFKTNEHANLLGGQAYEPYEENPMLGERGASKYVKQPYDKAFRMLDLRILQRVIVHMGYENIHIEVPFVRDTQELQNVITLVQEKGIHAPIDMMFELPVNVSRASEFFPLCHAGQIGSNDLLQLELGLDRSGGDIKSWHVDHLKFRIYKLHQRRMRYQEQTGKYFPMELCGNLPSTDPQFAQWLASLCPEKDSALEQKNFPSLGRVVDGFSVTPDAVIPALLGVTGESPEGKQTKTVFHEDGTISVNGEIVTDIVHA